MLLPQEPGIIEMFPRSLYTAPPLAKTTRDTQPTLLVSWWCTGFALVIILVRITGRYIRTERLFKEDKIMALSIIPLLARMALVHVVLRFGTNNAVISDQLDAEGLRRRKIGSQCVLASRILYAAFLWIAKLTVSEFLKRLTSRFWRRSYERGLQTIRYFLLFTFIGVVIATLAECQPFNHYWQVRPDPGPQCRQGMPQLFTMGVSDMVTDILLVSFPIPIVFNSQMPLQRKISLSALFALSLILVAITLYRVIEVVHHDYDQQFRSLLASLEILAAAAVSNALVLGSFVRDRGEKKRRWHHHTTSISAQSSQEHKPVRRLVTQQNWGSDADLAADLGISCAQDLREKPSDTLRPAPMALPTEQDAKNLTPLPRHQSAKDDDLDLDIDQNGRRTGQSENHHASPHSPTKAAFFDIGGLLGDDESRPKSRQASPSSPPVQNFSRPISPQPNALQPASHRPQVSRSGSDTFLEDVGGLLSTDTLSSGEASKFNRGNLSLVDVLRESGPEPSTDNRRPNKAASMNMPEIMDAGGLLK